MRVIYYEWLTQNLIMILDDNRPRNDEIPILPSIGEKISLDGQPWEGPRVHPSGEFWKVLQIVHQYRDGILNSIEIVCEKSEAP
jgi:hypothetical protein